MFNFLKGYILEWGISLSTKTTMGRSLALLVRDFGSVCVCGFVGICQSKQNKKINQPPSFFSMKCIWKFWANCQLQDIQLLFDTWTINITDQNYVFHMPTGRKMQIRWFNHIVNANRIQHKKKICTDHLHQSKPYPIRYDPGINLSIC